MLGSKKIAARLLLVALAASAAAQIRPELPAGKLPQIERAISSEMSRQGIPGMSVAVAAGNRLVWMGGFGLSDVENYVPAKAATVYRLASISKPITAVAVMQLAERGRLDLDAPVQKYVPTFPRKPWPLTPRHLLSHQGGVRHYSSDSELNSTRHYKELLQTLQIFQADALLFEPGTGYSYTTYGYNLLGAVVEGASGMSFVEYLRKHIFEPAGMKRAGADHVHRIIPNRARGYRRTPDGTLENCALADTSNKIPGGGMSATAEDLADFAIQVQTGGLLRAETVKRMFSQQRTRDGKPVPYGLGWQIEERDGKRWVAHGGAQQGVRTLLLMQPENGFAVALMANVEGVDLRLLANEIAKIVIP